MQEHSTSGDNVRSSAVSVTAPGLQVELIWDKLGKPFAARDLIKALDRYVKFHKAAGIEEQTES